MIDLQDLVDRLQAEREKIDTALEALAPLVTPAPAKVARPANGKRSVEVRDWKVTRRKKPKVKRQAKVKRRKYKPRKPKVEGIRDLGAASAREVTAQLPKLEGPGKGRKRCRHCQHISGASAVICDECSEIFR